MKNFICKTVETIMVGYFSDLENLSGAPCFLQIRFSKLISSESVSISKNKIANLLS